MYKLYIDHDVVFLWGVLDMWGLETDIAEFFKKCP